MVAHILCLVLLLPALVACAYYLTLAAVGLWARCRPPFVVGDADRSFVILIPAHDEEATLERVLRSCAELEYPRERFQVVVIADNCRDDTAAVARSAGAVCLERTDPEHPGKGHAIAFALRHVLAQPWDAVVILDADCTLDRHALRAFARRLNRGEPVLQARVAAANIDDSPISYAVAVGNVLENDLVYLPRSRLGAALMLRGTGMVFATEVLRAHPWQAFSVVEDREYSLRLLQAGIAVRWVQEVTVASIYPAGREQLQVQRSRWSAALGRQSGAGLPWRNRAELLASRLLLSRPLVLLELLLAAGSATLCLLLVPGETSTLLAGITALVVLLQGLYFGLGVLLLGLTWRRLGLLLAAPVVVGRLIFITLAGLLGRWPASWNRTPRGRPGETPHGKVRAGRKPIDSLT
jgi:glycosyltransferase involved in cell wall biosynthesis